MSPIYKNKKGVYQTTQRRRIQRRICASRPKRQRTRKQRGGAGAGAGAGASSSVANPTFHILIASAGRPALKRLLDGLKPQLTAQDAITLVFDGGSAAKAKADWADSWKDGFKCPIHVLEEPTPLGSWGHAVRNKYQGQLQTPTTFILHADDDDQYVPTAFTTLRERCKNPDTLYLFQIRLPDGREIPVPGMTPFAVGNIGTPCGVIPFAKAAEARWADEVGGDGKYYIHLSSKIPTTERIDTVLYTCRDAQGP